MEITAASRQAAPIRQSKTNISTSMDTNRVMAVSYTHLDVYKRQDKRNENRDKTDGRRSENDNKIN